MQLYSQYTKDSEFWNIKSVDELKGRTDIKALKPTGEECYTAQEPNSNTSATGQWCIIKDRETGQWAILLELDHWRFSHFMPYNGCGMGTVGMYATAKVAKQNARSLWPNTVKVHKAALMSKPVYDEYLEVL